MGSGRLFGGRLRVGRGSGGEAKELAHELILRWSLWSGLGVV